MPDALDAEFDLAIVGGGIHGAWAARDAALRGLRVALVEAEDYGWGTSAKSSKLAHGGLRYLEQLEFGLVHEALQERERLMRLAPHLVRPLPFVYPIYPGVKARFTVGPGLMLYDILSRGRSVPGHSRISAQETAQRVPALKRDSLRGAATFYDAQISSVERLVAELVWDARRQGAVAMNHTRVLAIERNAARVHGVRIRTADGERTLRARTVLNAAGPWLDQVLSDEQGGPIASERLVRTTKGIHLVVPKFTDVAVMVRTRRDDRTFFVLPWGEHSVIGTTDTDYEGDPSAVRAEAGDVSYLQEAVRAWFPDAPVDRVLYTYAGVRSLVRQTGRSASRVTRRHILHAHAGDGAAGLWSLQGGKITTARHAAEDAVDVVCRHLGRGDLASQHPTRTAPLPGCPAAPWGSFRTAAAASLGHPLDSARHIVDTYGARAAAVAQRGTIRLVGDRPHVSGEIVWAVREEQATTIADVMLRRTTLGLAAGGARLAAEAAADQMQGLLKWDDARRGRELTAYTQAVAVLAVPISRPDQQGP